LIHKILTVEFLLRLNNEPNEPLPQMILPANSAVAVRPNLAYKFIDENEAAGFQP
jgi:hypothetical protein